MNEVNGQQLPPGWAAATLGAIVEPRIGKTDPQATPFVKFIGMEQVEAHTMRLLGTVPASTMKSGANVFQPFDVLYGRMRAYLNKVYQPDFGGLCSGEFIVLPETCAVLGRFLKYRLNAGDFVRFANHLNTGDRPRVDFDQIKLFPLLLPPMPEQERIADALDEILSDLDAGMAALERVKAKLKHFRAAVLKAAVEGALTAEWRIQNPTTEPASVLLTRILAERRRRWEEAQLQKFKEAGKEPPKNWKAKYKEATAPVLSKPLSLPEGWCCVSLDQILWQLRSGSSETSGRKSTTYPILKSSAVRHGAIDFTDINYLNESQSARPENFIQSGDFLITRLSGSVHYVGCSAVVGANAPEGIQYPDRIFCGKLTSMIKGAFLTYCFQHSGVRRVLEEAAKSTAGHQRISLTDLTSLVIPLPSLAEQEAIVEAVEDQLSIVDHLEADLEVKLKNAQVLRQSILHHAFTGQLVPQDQNDEPAAELLKRIAAEREELTRLAQAAKQAKRTKPKFKTKLEMKPKPRRNARHKTQLKSTRKHATKHTLKKELS